MQPLFKVGEVAYHGNTRCRVTKIINISDKSDFKIQGYRYYVEHSGHTWSVPEYSLDGVPRNGHFYCSLPLAPEKIKN